MLIASIIHVDRRGLVPRVHIRLECGRILIAFVHIVHLVNHTRHGGQRVRGARWDSIMIWETGAH